MAFDPRYIVTKAPGVDGDPIPEDEPCLVIRGQDYLAMYIMNEYIRQYSLNKDADKAVLQDLRIHAEYLAEYQKTHTVKWADR